MLHCLLRSIFEICICYYLYKYSYFKKCIVHFSRDNELNPFIFLWWIVKNVRIIYYTYIFFYIIFLDHLAWDRSCITGGSWEKSLSYFFHFWHFHKLEDQSNDEDLNFNFEISRGVSPFADFSSQKLRVLNRHYLSW